MSFEDYQLPLVLFTVMSQWGVGAVLALTLYQGVTAKSANAFQGKSLRYLVAAIWLIEVVGSSMSMGHLGTPFAAYRSVLGIAHSWLSREAIVFVMLNGLISLWALSNWLQPRASARNLWLGILCSVFGLPAILVTAQVYYQMLAHPLWHTPATQFSFIGSALILGFASLLLIINGMKKPIPCSLRVGLFISLLCVLISLIIRFQIPGVLSSSYLLWWQIAMSLVLPAIVLGRSKSTHDPLPIALLMILLIFSGELAGRMLFYGNVMMGAPWF